jgi:class 3 adenylate cyclase
MSAGLGRSILSGGRVDRRLAAILAADVAGYSRLIGGDEEGTLGRLRSIRAEVIDPNIHEHRGRLVKTTGDVLLIEFASVIDPPALRDRGSAGDVADACGSSSGKRRFGDYPIPSHATSRGVSPSSPTEFG